MNQTINVKCPKCEKVEDMKYLKINWKTALKEGYFIQVGESYKECRKEAEERADYESVSITSFQFSNEEEYEEYLEKDRKKYFKTK